ncbi:Endonuclease III [Candidatus Gromoviella agglomerans]|nr:Endonuclease III [Candidatus Gromoviella agglomerans]
MILHNATPIVETELVYKSPYTLLIAVILSARCKDVVVNKVTPVLFKDGDTPEHIYSLGIIEIEKRINKIGLYRSKARYINELSKILIEKFNSNVPNNRKDLESLPGVGRKSANVILNILYGEPTIAVDTHVFRVSNRLGISHAKTPREVEIVLNEITPNEIKKTIHSTMVMHGRYICRSRLPLCDKCPVSEFCAYFSNLTVI